jgi:hypothetical protein
MYVPQPKKMEENMIKVTMAASFDLGSERVWYTKRWSVPSIDSEAAIALSASNRGARAHHLYPV